MNKILLAVGVALLLIIISFFFSKPSMNRLLSSNEFITKYKSIPEAVLLDVRTPQEFYSGSISGAINVDFENPNFENEVQKLDHSKPYFVYCRSGNRSSGSVIVMKKNGFKDVYELQDGIVSAPELLK